MCLLFWALQYAMVLNASMWPLKVSAAWFFLLMNDYFQDRISYIARLPRGIRVKEPEPEIVTGFETGIFGPVFRSWTKVPPIFFLEGSHPTFIYPFWLVNVRNLIWSDPCPKFQFRSEYVFFPRGLNPDPVLCIPHQQLVYMYCGLWRGNLRNCVRGFSLILGGPGVVIVNRIFFTLSGQHFQLLRSYGSWPCFYEIYI